MIIILTYFDTVRQETFGDKNFRGFGDSLMITKFYSLKFT